MFSWQALTEDQIHQIQRASEDVLERSGFKVLDEAALTVCRKAGAEVDAAAGRVRLPRELLRELVHQAPGSYTVTGLDGLQRRIGAGETWGFAITNDPWVIDYPTQRPRRPRSDDVRRNTIIGQRLEHVLGMSCMDFPVSDWPGPHANLRALEVHLLAHAKHNFVLPTSVESMHRWLQIGRILARGKELRGSSLLTVGVPSLTPLTVTGANVELIRIACAHELPVVPTVCPTAGMTSPYSMAGTLVLGNAEMLFMLALVQLHRRGHPFMASLGPAVADMRNGASLYYTLDKVLWKAAYLQLAKSYGLPAVAECGGAMVHRFDQQSGAEGMLFMLSAVAGGADLLAGFGSTYNAVGHSTEMMLIQDAWLAAAKFLRRGIDCSQQQLAVDAIVRMGPGGQYLTDELTLKYLRARQFFAHELFDLSADSAGSQSLLERAHEKAETLVADFTSPVPGDVQEELRRFFREATTS
ncbi:MAG: trimethylamine methyltransferase family protein [Phycisphaerales bacterium]|jgi:trimethylamine--corrinoid protein Co-methyltransferase